MNLAYWRYLLRHKWFVLVACFDLGITWQGIVHDWSKFLPDEWMPYAMSFYGPQPRTTATKQAFNVAWLKHIHRNPHHWQHWLLHEDNGGVKALEMPYRYVLEMLADWKGAGRAQGKSDTLGWYIDHYEIIQLHPQTRTLLHSLLAGSPETARRLEMATLESVK